MSPRPTNLKEASERVKELKDALRLARDIAGVLPDDEVSKVHEAVVVIAKALALSVMEVATLAKSE